MFLKKLIIFGTATRELPRCLPAPGIGARGARTTLSPNLFLAVHDNDGAFVLIVQNSTHRPLPVDTARILHIPTLLAVPHFASRLGSIVLANRGLAPSPLPLSLKSVYYSSQSLAGTSHLVLPNLHLISSPPPGVDTASYGFRGSAADSSRPCTSTQSHLLCANSAMGW